MKTSQSSVSPRRRGQVRRRPGRLDERREAREVVGLHVGLKDSHDWGAGSLRLLEITVNEGFVWIYDRELALRQAAEQV